MRGLLAGLLSLGVGACAPTFEQSARMLGRGLDARDVEVQHHRSYFDAERTRPHRDWSFEILPNGASQPHGRDTCRYESGQLEYEREYLHGEPVGTWRSWWPNGKQRSEVPQNPRTAELTRWWHESGALECEGPAVAGLKQGAWKHFHPDGVLAAEGRYASGAREGEWSFYDAKGALVEQIAFRNGVRLAKPVDR